MKFINRTSVQRMIQGYPEVVIIEVYSTWCMGNQVYVVSHIPNDTDLESKVSKGIWFVDPTELCRYINRLKVSFVVGEAVDFSDIAAYTKQSLIECLVDAPSDECEWRLVIRETSVEPKPHGFFRLAVAKEFAVCFNRDDGICNMPYLVSTNASGVKATTFSSFAIAEVTALGLAALSYATTWSYSIASIFEMPTVAIQRKCGDDWNDYQTYDLISVEHTLVFAEDFSNHRITHLG